MRPDQDPDDEDDKGVDRCAGAGAIPREFSAKPSLALTLTEKGVLHIVSQSHTSREIARHLGR